MDEEQFRRLLDMFPVVRSRDFCAENEQLPAASAQSERNAVTEWQDAWEDFDVKRNSDERDPFWQHLRSTVEEKFGTEFANKFCKAFQKVHEQLVNTALPLEKVKRIVAPSSEF